ncbi:MAG TPA: MBL fold metallo-hydrolase [Candidatus Dormibacteraeota bacterium]|nr:MBL fold metallo-hydrolase [Candidatus Dormibacteraeota bacterium]
MMKIPLEDNFNDVLGKAQRGLQLNDQQLSVQSNVSVADLSRVKEGEFDEAVVRKLAKPLKLRLEALVELGKKAWYPQQDGGIPGLACFNTTYGDMTVNSYLVWDPKTSHAACFDTGADCSGMLEAAQAKNLRIQMILLTHTHPDHIADLARLKQATQGAAFVSKLEPIDGAETFEVGRKFTLGTLQIEARLTSGHSRGGVTYVVNGLPRKIAVVGDSMFAGSMGGGNVSYSDALKNNCEKILTLPEDTIICPGHGPLTTVGEEKEHNPFFPDV